MIAGGALNACADLNELAQNQCGNGVVEEPNGEDCDSRPLDAEGKPTDPGKGFACSSCRVLCDGQNHCPDGWGCGTDGICRRPTGTFEAADVPIAENVKTMLVADLDGDRQMELVVDTGADLRVHYFDQGANVVETSSIAAIDSSPATGDFDADGIADLAYHLDVAFAVRLGSADRSLPANPFPLPLPSDLAVKNGERLIGIDAFGIDASDFQLRELLRVDSSTITTFLDGKKSKKPALLAKVGTSSLVSPDAEIPTGRLIEGSPCDQFVLGNKDNDRVQIFTSCRDFAGVTGWNDLSLTGAVPPIEITIPAAAKIKGPVSILDVDGDGHLDVAVYAATDDAGTFAQIDVAYGNGKGQFSSTPGGLADQHAAPHLCLAFADLGQPAGQQGDPYFLGCLKRTPLAFADFNGDHKLDLVSPCGVFLTSGEIDPACGKKQSMIPVVSATFGLAGAEWTAARVVDLNADRVPDVVAASCADTSISYYESTGTGIFNGFRIPTDGGVNKLQVGDFDGDLVPDVLFTERVSPLVCTSTSIESAKESIGVIFGAKSAGPDGPYALGTVDAVHQVVAADLTSPANQYDLVTDLAVVSNDPKSPDPQDPNAVKYDRFTIFQGASDRQIIAPHYLVAPDTGDANLPWLVTMGHFTDAKQAGVALVSFERKDNAMGKPPSNRARLWVFGSDGADVTTDVPLVLDPLGDPSQFLFDSSKGAWLGSTNLGSSTTDQILGLVQNGQGAKLFVYGRASGGWASAVPDPITLPGAYRGPFAFADVDADGNQDLVLTSPADGVIVLWGSGKGTFDHDADGNVLEAARSLVKADDLLTACEGDPEAFVGAVPLRASASKDLSLVILTNAHAYLAKLADAKARKLSYTCIDDWVTPPPEGFAGAYLAAGDVGGDGIDDLIVGRPGAVTIFHGKAVVP
jgi:hypothetical protein